MSLHRHLSGGCTCGRNTYIVQFPSSPTSEIAQVYFDSSSPNRRAHASPLSAFLRIPLSWYQSTTHAFFPDETHSSIRRTYESPFEQGITKRYFCGFCGTPLAWWSEEPRSEADYISLTLGSLRGEDLRDLEEWGVLPKEALGDVTMIGGTGDMGERKGQERGSGEVTERDPERLPWFEEMVQGSRLGNVKRSSGRRVGGDGKTRVEWEIVEWSAEDDAADGGVKRKRQDSGGNDAMVE